jgi:hypothetical protein
MPLGSFTNIVDLSEFALDCVEGRRQRNIKFVLVVVPAAILKEAEATV